MENLHQSSLGDHIETEMVKTEITNMVKPEITNMVNISHTFRYFKHDINEEDPNLYGNIVWKRGYIITSECPEYYDAPSKKKNLPDNINNNWTKCKVKDKYLKYNTIYSINKYKSCRDKYGVGVEHVFFTIYDKLGGFKKFENDMKIFIYPYFNNIYENKGRYFEYRVYEVEYDMNDFKACYGNRYTKYIKIIKQVTNDFVKKINGLHITFDINYQYHSFNDLPAIMYDDNDHEHQISMWFNHGQISRTTKTKTGSHLPAYIKQSTSKEKNYCQIVYCENGEKSRNEKWHKDIIYHAINHEENITLNLFKLRSQLDNQINPSYMRYLPAYIMLENSKITCEYYINGKNPHNHIFYEHYSNDLPCSLKLNYEYRKKNNGPKITIRYDQHYWDSQNCILKQEYWCYANTPDIRYRGEEDLPAKIDYYASGKKKREIWVNDKGKLHRENNPAMIHYDKEGYERDYLFYNNGKRIYL